MCATMFHFSKIGACIKSGFKNYMKTWPKMYRQLYFIVDTNEFTVELQRNTHDCLRQQGCGSVSRFFFFFRFRTHLCIRESSYGTLIKNEPLFIEFTIFHVSSRRNFHPPRESVRFSKLRLTRYVEYLRVDILWGARWREKRRRLYITITA